LNFAGRGWVTLEMGGKDRKMREKKQRISNEKTGLSAMIR
jgi:hypothetical protein